jgi:RNA recognition motif-containing protein
VLVKNIYVGNLAFTANEEGVRALFAPYGQVDRVQLITDRDTGQPRGFGFVEMPDDAQGEAAINALNGAAAFGRTLSVNEAKPRGDRPQRGGSGSGAGRDRGARDNRSQRW